MIRDAASCGENVKPSVDSIINRLVKVGGRVVCHAGEWQVSVASVHGPRRWRPVHLIPIQYGGAAKRNDQLRGKKVGPETAKTGPVDLSLAFFRRIFDDSTGLHRVSRAFSGGIQSRDAARHPLTVKLKHYSG
jgi:hypothetical protein